MIRKRQTLETPGDKNEYEECDAIEARYEGKDKYFPGTISRVNADGTYKIMYEDGDSELHVDASMIRKRQTLETPGDKNEYEEGDAIEARYEGKDKYFPGTISRVNADGTYKIMYEDG